MILTMWLLDPVSRTSISEEPDAIGQSGSMQKSKGITSARPEKSVTHIAKPWWQGTGLVVAQWLTLLVIFYFYLLLRVESHLFYHQNSSLFLLTNEFFQPFLERPGGMVAWLSAFLSATMVVNWLGSAVLTLLTVLIALATRQLLVSSVCTDMRWLPVVPAVFLLMLLCQYVNVVELGVGLVAVLWLARVYLLFKNQQMAVRLIAFVVLSVIAYYLAAGMYLVFACFCSVYELAVRRQIPLGVLAFLCAFLVPLAGTRWFDLSFDDACCGLVLHSTHWLAIPTHRWLAFGIRISLFLFFPVSLAILAWRGRRARHVEDGATPRDARESSEGPDLTRTLERLRWIAPPLGFALLLLAVDMALFDLATKCLLQMDCCSADKRWEDMLAWAERMPQSEAVARDIRTKSQLNRALYFTGQLPEQMFAYHQLLDTPSLALVARNLTDMARATPRQCGEVFFELGRVNEAEHMTSEALEIYGDWPCLLERLMRINVLKGRPAAAKKFLALMECSLLHANRARQIGEQLDADSSLANDPVVASRRKLMVRNDSMGDATNLEAMLLELLEANPGNQMAFEYLMAHYLLTRQVDKVADNLYRLDHFDYPCIPRHYEEALLLSKKADGAKDVDLGSRSVRQVAKNRLAAFLANLERFPSHRAEEAYTALYPDFGDSYYFFFIFGTNHDPARLPRLK